MIRSFADRDTEKVFGGERSRKFDAIARVALRKLLMLNAVELLDDLRSPPGNRLDALAESRRGEHSIRVNDQWRIVFVWRGDGPHDVAIVDYH
jgi:proteic killer suppression protein